MQIFKGGFGRDLMVFLKRKGREHFEQLMQYYDDQLDIHRRFKESS